MEKIVNVIGAGLAGCECAYKLANNGIKVKLYEMKPDYSQYDSPHEVLYTVSYTGEWENEEDYFLLTCYFDAPAE